MNNFLRFILIIFFFFSTSLFGQKSSEEKINELLDSWHKAASEANFDAYFSKMASNAVFIGTDATENWQKKEFKEFSKPYFDKGKAWSFTAVERHIYTDKNMAWFDELLDTQMKLCRGSGVVKKIKGEWKILHYVLSMAIPNDHVNEVIKLKQQFDDTLLQKLIDTP